jgi:hypothetical protein
MKTPILGSSYVARSVNAAASRMVNLFPESIPGEGKEAAFLQRCPGLRFLGLVGPDQGPIRGMQAFGGYAYVVSRNQLCKVAPDFTHEVLGDVGGTTSPVYMANNGIQLFVVSDTNGYVYNADTDAFAQVTDPDFPGASSIGYLGGYFVFSEPNTNRIWVSELDDPLSIEPLDFASAEGSPDNIVSILIDHNEVWIFGTNSIEVWRNTGDVGFPLTPISGAFIEIGLLAAASVAKLDNGIFWLGGDDRGRGMVYRSNGYNGTRVSTHAVEWQIQEYDDISDAIGYTYQQDGHSFYVLVFPSARTTWVYDVSTGAWHERAGLENGQFTRHRGNCQMVFSNEIVIGDSRFGMLLAYDLNDFRDVERPQKWLRSWRAIPPGRNSLRRTTHHSLQLDCESGVGFGRGQVQDADFSPAVNLRWSDDGGHTWSNYHSKPMGRVGNTGQRVIWRRLGSTEKLRDRVYEVSGSAAVKIAIMGAEVMASTNND